MRKTILIFLVATLVSACSSQQDYLLTDPIWHHIDPPRGRYNVKYDESKIFPSPNQKLACQMDWTCKKPLTEGEFERLSDEDKFRVMNGDDLKPKY